MTLMTYLDTSDLINRLKAGLGPSWKPGDPVPNDAFRFLNDLLAGDVQAITNSKIIRELTQGGHADGLLVEQWLNAEEALGKVKVHYLSEAELDQYNVPDGGERSLAELTAKHPDFSGSLEDARFMSTEDFSQRQFFTNAGYDESHFRTAPGAYTEQFARSGLDADFAKGMDYVHSARSIGLHENAIFGRNLGSNRQLGDLYRSLPFDESGASTIPEFGGKHWGDLSDYVRGNMLRLAGEAVGVFAVALDAYTTWRDFAEALARGDLAAADDLLGGLIGRSFGGAFLAAVGTGAGAGAFAGTLGGPLGAIIGGILGGIAGALGGDEIGSWLFGALNDAGFSLSEIVDEVSDMLRDIMSDPLVLDLDGDGIELIALSSSTTVFDLDDDAFAERVGWVSPHDGLLVHDANGNGLVDGIDELFGSAEVDGFEELATLDSNADGRIDALDPDFGELLVWRDLNADGLSTPDEMLTLAQAGITHFDLEFSQVDAKAGGNVIARKGNYVRADGGTRDMASVRFGMDESGDRPTIPQGVDLGNLPILPNLPAVAGMPDLRTSMYFDPVLKAMVESLVFGAQDFDTFVEFVGGGADMVGPMSTIEGRFIEVLYKWAEVDTTAPEDLDFPYHLQVFEAVTGMPLEVTNDHQRERLADLWPAFVKQLGVQFLFQAANNPKLAPIYELAGDLSALDPADPTYLDQLSTLTESAIAAASSINPAYDYLSRFTGLTMDPTTGELSGDFDAFVGRFIEDQPSFTTYVSSSVGGGRPTLSSSVIVGDGRHPWTAWYEDQGSLLFYIADKMDIGSAYVLNVTGWRWLHGEATDHEGTAGADLLDFGVTYYTRVTDGWGPSGPTTTIEQVPTYDQRIFGFEGDDELRGNSGVDRLVGGTDNDLLKGGASSDMYVYASGDGLDRIIDDSGADDVIYFSSELNREDLRVERLTGTNDLILHFGNPAEGIILTGQVASADAAIEQLHFVGEDGLDAGDIATLCLATLSTEGADAFGGTWAGETIRGLGGNDTLNGWGGSDRIEGGDGNDVISGDSGNDVLLGGDGDDQLLGQSGNDILDGGTGNDLMRGGGDDDVYRFDRGGGQDTVRDFIENTLVNFGGDDLVEMGEGISPADITVVQSNSGKDLILKVNGTTDQLRLYETTDDSTHRIERVIFADGTIWTHAEMLALATTPTSGADTFYGGYNSESLAGGDGNDTLFGNKGNDILAGGSGNDSLRGGGDNDTYLFELGGGQDVIYDHISNTLVNNGGNDVLIFGAGIEVSDLSVIQGDSGDDLVIRIIGTADQVTLNETVSDSGSRIESVLLAGGTVLTHSTLMQMATTATPGDDVFYGGGGADTLAGGEGNDTLIANKGNDILEGGPGDDVLKGGGGNDRYFFSIGDGRDSIYDHISNTLVNTGGTDKLEFGDGILPSGVSVSFADSNDDLVLKIDGTSDQVILQEAVSNSNYRIEQVVFADGTIWTHANMVAMASAPPSAAFAPIGAASSSFNHGLYHGVRMPVEDSFASSVENAQILGTASLFAF